MATKTTIPFKGTKEQEEKLLKVIAEHKGEQGVSTAFFHGSTSINQNSHIAGFYYLHYTTG